MQVWWFRYDSHNSHWHRHCFVQSPFLFSLCPNTSDDKGGLTVTKRGTEKTQNKGKYKNHVMTTIVQELKKKKQTKKQQIGFKFHFRKEDENSPFGFWPSQKVTVTSGLIFLSKDFYISFFIYLSSYSCGILSFFKILFLLGDHRSLQLVNKNAIFLNNKSLILYKKNFYLIVFPNHWTAIHICLYVHSVI